MPNNNEAVLGLTKVPSKKYSYGHLSARQNLTTNFKTGPLNHLSKRIKPELYRLSTFRSWKENTQCNVSAVVLSQVGFIYTGKDDRVRCQTCGLEIDSWKTGMDPKQEHMERSPLCPFVLKEQELFTKNGIEQTLSLSH